LVAVLEAAQRHGFLGPGPVEAHIDHALGLAALIATPPRAALDLGSGAGVPGLVLALHWPASRWILLDAGARRTALLTQAVSALRLADRVDVLCARAEDAGRDPGLRGSCDLVTARSFGPPAVTAECAAPFLRVGGVVAVTEPPGNEPRWPIEGLAVLGLTLGPRSESPHVQQLIATAQCPDRYPRRVGMPAKRPLF